MENVSKDILIFLARIGDLYCNFQYDYGVWRHPDVSRTFSWTRRSGSTPSFQTGPSVDHTFGNTTGYYKTLEIKDHIYLLSDKAVCNFILIYPMGIIAPTNSSCGSSLYSSKIILMILLNSCNRFHSYYQLLYI